MPLNDFPEYVFRIEGLTPETLSMVRLAEYLADLAKLMGAKDNVHFDCIEDGSAVLRMRVETDAHPVVSPRVRRAARSDAPEDVAKAWRSLNRRLSDDHSTAKMSLPGGEVVEFPGAQSPEKPIGPIRQPTSVQGRLVRIEGGGARVSVGIDDSTRLAPGVTIAADQAKALGQFFHRHVRLTGTGTWRCDADGTWFLLSLEADRFDVLDDEPLIDTIHRAREMVPGGFGEAAIRILREIQGE
jgi:hypothetical protein